LIRSSAIDVCAIVLVIFARSCTGLKNFDRYARNTVSAPTDIAPAMISAVPRQSTNAVHAATTMVTTGERTDLMRRAFSDASTVARLAASIRCASRSCRPKASTTRIEPRPCSTTETMSLCLRRTSRVAPLTAFLKRATNSSRNGVMATAISAKSQFSQNMIPSMPTIVIASTRMTSVADDAKSCTVATSLVIVESSAPLCSLS
jgi:hypothetical protein